MTAALVLTGQLSPLTPWQDRPVLSVVVERVAGWGLKPMVVVLGRDAEEALEEVDFAGAIVAIDWSWEEGAASLLRVGLDTILQLEENIDALVVASGEVPMVPDTVVPRLLRHPGERPAVVARYRYANGLPVLVRRPVWERLMSLEANQSLLSWLVAHPELSDEALIEALPPRSISDLVSEP